MEFRKDVIYSFMMALHSINIFDIYLQVCTGYCFIRLKDFHLRAG